jgi:hypothetical protein
MTVAVDTTVALTGILPEVMIASAVLTAVAAGFLLWLYRRAVVRAMGATAGAADMRVPSAASPEGPDADFPPLVITRSMSTAQQSNRVRLNNPIGRQVDP